MAKTYNYTDFEEALKKSGMGNQFSSADLALAKKNPDAGMSLLSYKQDYANATTDEMRALANAGAEEIRSSFGEYTGGTDGSQFYRTPLSPESYEYGDAPSFTDKYGGDIEKLIADQTSRGPYSYSGAMPTYDSRYQADIDRLTADILGRDDFSYDHTSDPLYSAYAKQYTREGKRATADALGEAASATGGMPSSYAVTAASQAGDYYAAQMADKIPELYQIAYDKYLNEYNMKLSDMNMLQGLEQFDYSKHQDELSQYNRDREFDYAKWLDEYEMGQNNIDTLRGLRDDDYSRYLTELSQYNTDREFDYGQLLDEISSQASERTEKRDAELSDYEKAWNEEERAYSRAWDEEERAYNRAWNEEERTYSRAQDEREYQLQLAKLLNDSESGESDGVVLPTADGDVMSEDITSALRADYPDGVVDNAEMWDALVNAYGEDVLAAAGYSFGEESTNGGYDSETLALNLYHGAAELGITTWDAFKSALVDNGVSEAEAERLTNSYKEKYGENIFNRGTLAAVQGAQRFMN